MKGNHVAVLGAGAWGTALAIAAARAGREVTLWGRDPTRMARMAASRHCGAVLDDLPLEAAITPTDALEAAVKAPILILAVPTQALRQVCEALALVLPPGRALLCAAKGIERGSGLFVSEVMADCLAGQRYGILSGPSFAADVARGLPTALALAMAEAADAEVLAAFLASPAFRLYHSQDLRGVEIGGAAKNVLAIAAGVVMGMGLGESARAAMIARGFAEIRRFAAAYGAKPETLMGLSGLGDLVLTASSPQSRNFSLGFGLGCGKRLAEAAEGKLAEGAFTAAILNDMALARGIDMPIVSAVTKLIENGLPPDQLLRELMARPIKAE